MFQKRTLEKYIAQEDKSILLEKYRIYSSIFLNENKQVNIRMSKEEQYQEGFLRDLFVSVLGYTIKPEENYNLFTEAKNDVKNKSNSRKADGAICEKNDESKLRAVIELKGTQTTDLNTVAFQAFSYKNFHSGCRYVIVSNFERLRLYVDVQSDYEEFDLFKLTFERFCILYSLLEVNKIMADVPLMLKNESLSEEKQITEEFYAAYSAFKRLLFEDICKRNLKNPLFDKLMLFKKTQKLLDRILFIRFCSDRGLLPQNSVLKIIKRWQTSKENFLDVPLYSLFKQYFNWIDKGFENPKNKDESIFAYNGGLFKNDEILDSIEIGDDVLYIHCNKLAQYDFQSQISVDILGRIFENSLTEIEEIQEEIKNDASDAEKSSSEVKKAETGKRKKDGVFYTPEYITRYIVENTIGKLCLDKRKEFGITSDVYSRDKNYSKKEIIELEERLNDYRKYLLGLKILDPACGSGAFLNAALKSLREEHTFIDNCFEVIQKTELSSMNMESIVTDNTILENNLFGVDINEESVEIAKLSLWLSTAKRNRKLSTLANNIKCGNSLISDKTVAGEKAFDWEKEFPQVFASTTLSNRDSTTLSNRSLSVVEGNCCPSLGGFDVVIGNPPYVSVNNIKDTGAKDYYKSHYKTANEMFDLYSIFTEKASSLLKPNGLFGFIFSNSWLGIKSFSSFREFLAKDVTVTRLVQLPEKVFADATVKTIICMYSNKKPDEDSEIEIEKCEDGKFFSKGFTLPYKTILSTHGYNFTLEKNIELDKVQTVKLGEIMKASCGIKSANDKKFILTEKIDDACYPLIRGRNIKRWEKPVNVGEYIWYKPELMAENVNARPRDLAFFTVSQKIFIQEMSMDINATLDCEKFLCNDKVNLIYELKDGYDMKYILSLLNSRLISFWFRKLFTSGFEIKINQLEQIPIPAISPDAQKSFVSLADKMLSLTAESQKKCERFLSRVKDNLKPTKISSALESFHALSFAEFVKELGKQKVKLSLKQQDEWQEYFDEYKSEITALKEQIDATDKAINAAVYALYGLTEEEIQSVEGKTES